MARLTVPLILFLAGTTAGFAQEIPPLVARSGYADLVLTNGKIVSMDDRTITPDRPGRTFQAMAIKGKRILALGTAEEMARLSNSATRVVDLAGRTLIPGLIQTHYHLFSRAAGEYGPRLGLVDTSVKLAVAAEATAEATATKIRNSVLNAIRAQSIPKGEWITVRIEQGVTPTPGTVRTWLYQGRINRRQFDSAVPDHPLLVKTNVSGVFNQAAIREFKEVFPDWEESTDLENGPGSAANGYAPVPELQGLTFEFWWRDEPVEKMAEALRLHGLDLQRAGVTTAATRILFPSVIAAYHHLDREGRMPHRLAYYIESQRGNFFSLKATREFYRGMGAPWTNHKGGGEMLWLNGMANEIWDASDNEVCLGPDVPAPPEVKSRERCPQPGSRPWESIKTAVVHGWRPVQVHGTSSHGLRLFLQLLEEARQEGEYSVEYIKSLRPAVEHNQLVGTPPDVMEGVLKFGVILNVNTGRLRDLPASVGDYGDALIPFQMPVKTWINKGIRVTFEADGIEFWTPIHRLVTRQVRLANSEEIAVVRPEEAVDRVTALKMATTWASEYMLAEDTLGTLEPGKFADFVVLDRDFFTIPVEEIPDVKVILTALGGEIIYDARQPAGR